MKPTNSRGHGTALGDALLEFLIAHTGVASLSTLKHVRVNRCDTKTWSEEDQEYGKSLT